MNRDFINQFLELAKEKAGADWKKFYPRRIIPPTGYLSPAYYSASMWANIYAGQEHLADIVSPYVEMVAGKLIEAHVPTYFVGADILEAVMMTSPPVDCTMGEIKWPIESALFVLPIELTQRLFGAEVPFIAVSKFEAGYQFNGVATECARVISHYNVYNNLHGSLGGPTEYTNTNRLDRKVSDFVECDSLNVGIVIDGLAVTQDEILMQAKLNALTVKLLLVMASRPSLIEAGTLERKARVKHGREQEELWSPSFIGRRYVLPRREHQGGTHAGPRMHWRVGHMHTVSFGKDRLQKRLDWFEPVLVNAEPQDKNKTS